MKYMDNISQKYSTVIFTDELSSIHSLYNTHTCAQAVAAACAVIQLDKNMLNISTFHQTQAYNILSVLCVPEIYFILHFSLQNTIIKFYN